MTGQLWWDTARAAGLVSWCLLSASVLWGLSLTTRALGSRPRPNWMLDLHRFLGGLSVVFVGVHVAAIVGDSYVHFGLAEVLVPLASSWHPIAVAWGIVGMYLLLAVEVTSLLRRHLPRRIWRATHVLSFPLFVLATVHLLTAGTDAATWPVRAVVALTTVAVAGLTARRVHDLRHAPSHSRAARPGPRGSRTNGSPAPRPLRADVPVASR
jgi:DMSO/TMAO reductase YedYZ heme-binding membrane subunit